MYDIIQKPKLIGKLVRPTSKVWPGGSWIDNAIEEAEWGLIYLAESVGQTLYIEFLIGEIILKRTYTSESTFWQFNEEFKPNSR